MKEKIEYLKKYLPSDKLDDGIKLLESDIPVQYIVGNVDFYGNTINVNKNVLIPRFETELLVDKLIKRCKDKFFKKIDILDLCTGSGCIAITLDKEFLMMLWMLLWKIIRKIKLMLIFLRVRYFLMLIKSMMLLLVILHIYLMMKR